MALQYVATRRAGIPVKDFAAVISAAFLVHSVKILWAPVVDAFFSKRAWYLAGLGLAAAGVMASSLVPITPGTLRQLVVIVMASQLGLTLMGFACENFLAALPTEEKGRASGFYQAGNFIGLGVGGGLALELTSRMPHLWMAGAVVCVAMAPCALALVGMPEPSHKGEPVLLALRQLGRDFIALLAVKRGGRWIVSAVGVTGMLIALSPVSAGAAGNLWPSIADAWGASEGAVGLVNGWLGGVVGGLGALLGGWMADRLDRRVAYALAGALTAVSGLAMAAGPRAPWAFVAGALVYSLFNGVAYATFSAFVLDTIGHGAVATKYNIFAGLANFAIAYMNLVDAHAFDRWHATGMLVTDAAATFGGIAFLLAVVFALRRFAAPPAVGSG